MDRTIAMTDERTQDERIAARAAAWVVRLRADDAGPSDWIEAADWIEADPAHRLAFDEAEGLWNALDEARPAQRSEGGPAAVIDLASRRRVPAVPSRRWLVAAPAMAAAVAAAVFLAPLLAPVSTDVYQTAAGEQRTVTLADGSRLVLNGDSRVSVRMERGRRLVRMDRAEVMFDVARDAARPFEVTVGESRVRVLGTAFNIRRSGDETEVAVTRGLVQVSDLQSADHQVRLGVGDRVRRSDADDVLRTDRTDPDAAAAWTDGRRVYDDRPLSEIAQDLSRAFPTPVTVAPDAAGIRFSGVLILDDEDAVIARLERFVPVRATRGPEGVRLERR